MSDEDLRAALAGLRVRIPESVQDADALRAEVRAADAALGERLRAAAARRHAVVRRDRKGAAR